MSYKISKIAKTDDGASELVISGQLVVGFASRIKADLAKLKFKTKQVRIVVKNVEDLDLSIVQLFKALSLQCESNEIKVSFDFELNEDLKLLLSRSGVIKELNQ